MGMTSFYQGSLRYDIHGRKRKTKSMAKPKRKIQTFKEWKREPSLAEMQSREHREKYPSAPITSEYTPSKDSSWKQEESKNFTVAPAYNKGAYQVIPRKDVEHIGK